MSKKAAVLSVMLIALGGLLGFNLGSARVALAKGQSSSQGSGQVQPELPAPPAEWVLSTAVESTTASVTKAAGGAGVQHVIDCVSGSVFSTSSSGAGNEFTLLLEDHPSTGGTTFLSQWALPITYGEYGHGSVNLCGLNIVGSVNGSEQLTFDGGSTLIWESVTMIGHDAT